MLIHNFIVSTKLIENKIKYHTITTMSQIAHYAGIQELIARDVFEKIIAYEKNPNDESWMSPEAKEKIFQKRLTKTTKD